MSLQNCLLFCVFATQTKMFKDVKKFRLNIIQQYFWISLSFLLPDWSKVITMCVAHACNSTQQQAFSIRTILARCVHTAASSDLVLMKAWSRTSENSSNKQQVLIVVLTLKNSALHSLYGIQPGLVGEAALRRIGGTHKRQQEPCSELALLKYPSLCLQKGPNVDIRASPNGKDHKHSWGSNTLSLTPTPAHLSP